MSVIAAVAIVLPVLLWQTWSFLAPALDRKIQRSIPAFVPVVTALFAVEVAFAYLIVLPSAVEFLTNFDDSLYDVQIRASYYLSFTSMVLLACGLAFEMPIFILALVRLGLLSSTKLRRNRRIGYALMVSAAVLLPTVDPVSLAFEVAPLLILFESSIWLSLMERRWQTTALTPNIDEVVAALVDASLQQPFKQYESRRCRTSHGWCLPGSARRRCAAAAIPHEQRD